MIFKILTLFIFASYLSFYKLQGESFLWENSFIVGIILGGISILSLISCYYYKKELFKFLLGGFILTQLILIFSLGPVHNDSFRYMWDGKISGIGQSSFEYTPVEIVEKGLLNPDSLWFWNVLDFKHLHTIYPGTAQFFFLLGSFSLGNEIIIFRLILLFSALTIIYLLNKLDYTHKKILPFIILNPIFFFDGILAIHLEMILVLFLILTIYLIQQKKYLLSGIALSLTIFTKLYPVLLVPVFLLQKNISKPRFFTGLFLGIFINLPFIYQKSHIVNLLNSIKRFSTEWIASPGIYYFFEFIFKENTQNLMFIILIFSLIGIYYMVYKNKITLHQSILFVFGIYIFLSKTIFSWYLLPILILLIFVNWRTRLIFLAPLIIYPLQYLFVNGTNEVNNTFVYTNNGIAFWFQFLAWIPVIAIFVYFMQKKMKNKFI